MWFQRQLVSSLKERRMPKRRRRKKRPLEDPLPMLPLDPEPAIAAEAVAAPTGPQVAQEATDEDEEVTYLFSVAKGRLVETVDLADDGEAKEPQEGARSFVLHPAPEPPAPEINSRTTSNIMRDLKNRGVSVTNCSVKNKASPETTGERKRRKTTHLENCSECLTSYDLECDSRGLFYSPCGHLFCSTCIKSRDKCTKCGTKLASLGEIYLQKL